MRLVPSSVSLIVVVFLTGCYLKQVDVVEERAPSRLGNPRDGQCPGIGLHLTRGGIWTSKLV